MNCNTHTVKEDATRPTIGYLDECYICHVPVGEEHKQGCVFRERSVIIEVKFNLLVFKPEDWDIDMIEFHYNESSHCKSNFIEELQQLEDRVNCLCPFGEVTFIREATEEDEEDYGYKND